MPSAPDETRAAAASGAVTPVRHGCATLGCRRSKAEAIARQFKRRYEADREELVTRAYLDLALERQSAELKADLARIERDLILKLGGVITLAVAVVGALGVLF